VCQFAPAHNDFVNIATDTYNFDGLSTVPEQSKFSQKGIRDFFAPLPRSETYQSFDELQKEVRDLQEKNKRLAHSLTRKYNHCYKLQNKIRVLEKNIAQLVDDDEIFTSQSGMESANGDGEPGLSVEEPPPRSTEQITAFADEDAGWLTNVHSEYDETRDTVAAGDTGLGNFLERPIRALQTSWVVGQPLFTSFNPWSTFQLNDAVNDKLGNYELLRYKLHMKVVISGTPFHYGRAIVSYNPLSGLDEVTVTRNFLDVDVIGASQRPHFWLNPTTNEGGEMCMPFFWYDNYLSLSKADAASMGEVSIKSLGNLLHANGGDDPVTVTVYLWASDVVLTMPTSITDPTTMQQNLVLVSQAGKQGNGNNSKRTKGKGNTNQLNSGDEYGQGIISKPAAVIAKAAGVLEQIPMIAPYARATSMVADRIGKVAAIFGFSRPAVLTDIEPFKPNPTGNLANVDAADAVHKLTLDSKQELTIDSRTVGLDGVDQMGITDIACRESYLTSFTWQTSDAVDAILWNSYVTPNLFGINNTECHPTPMSMLAQMFRDWQGSIKFRFQIVKSQYHKGKMLVRYDPRSHSANIEYNENYSRVIDISAEDDFEIVVGWGQSDPFLECGPQMKENVTNYGTTRLTTDSLQRFNGVLELNVLNSLVSPSVDSDITVNVFVSMCDDAKFAYPSADKLRNLHYFPQQTPVFQEHDNGQDNPGILISQSGMQGSSSDMPMGATKLQTIAEEGAPADHTFEVFYGDVPVSLRDIFKRYIKIGTTIPSPPETTDTYRFTRYVRKIFPLYSGWDPQGIHTSEVDGTTKLNVIQTTPLNFMAPCYAGWRGSIRRKFVYHEDDKPVLLQPYVSNYNFGSQNIVNVDKPLATTNQNLEKTLSKNWNQFTLAGSTTTNIGINNTIEVEFPFYQDARFRSTRLIQADDLPGNNYQHGVTAYQAGAGANVTAQSTIFEEYVATGEDFSLFFWSGAPIIYNYSVTESS